MCLNCYDYYFKLFFIYFWLHMLLCMSFLQLQQAGAPHCSEWVLTVRASLVGPGLQARGCQQFQLTGSRTWSHSHGAPAKLPQGLWTLPRPGIKPESPAPAGGFLSTAPPGRSKYYFLIKKKTLNHLLICVLVAQLCPNSLQPHELQPIRHLCPWNSPGKNTGVGSHFLLQGIFITKASCISSRFFTI